MAGVPTGVGPNLSTLNSTTAGTRTQVSATNLLVEWFRLESVAGTIYVGDSTVSSTKYMLKLTAGVGYDFKMPGGGNNVVSAPNGRTFNLKHFWIDSAGNADKCQLTYFTRINDTI